MRPLRRKIWFLTNFLKGLWTGRMRHTRARRSSPAPGNDKNRRPLHNRRVRAEISLALDNASSLTHMSCLGIRDRPQTHMSHVYIWCQINTVANHKPLKWTMIHRTFLQWHVTMKPQCLIEIINGNIERTTFAKARSPSSFEPGTVFPGFARTSQNFNDSIPPFYNDAPSLVRTQFASLVASTLGGCFFT